MNEIPKPKFDGPLEVINPDKNDPMRKLSDEELRKIINEKSSIERALGDKPEHDKLIANIRRTIQAAEAILAGRCNGEAEL